MNRRRKNISAADLGIDLASRRERERFKWFLACLLFGRPSGPPPAPAMGWAVVVVIAFKPGTLSSSGKRVA